MNIPSKFESILAKNQKIEGVVKYTLSQYSDILYENKLYFFEEYTDHGIKHIESVLASSESLITNETFENVIGNSPITIGTYLLSVILHDIGMHITPEGFNALVSGCNDQIQMRELDDKTWKELWEDYLDDARRFGDIEKSQIIGDPNWEYRIPPIDNKDKLTGEDKKLIGEFIRRHHCRLAHEIAIAGFPTGASRIEFAKDLEDELKNISGLLARSHGLEIRNLFPYLEKLFQDTWTKPHNVDLIFMMVVLRIADYFQIDSSRTPEVTVKLKSFNSPISQLEHYKHLDVQYVQPFQKDPETIIFQCKPRSGLIFVKLKDLFGDIQNELDKSWAVLGEIYGKESKVNQPCIHYRRVKSNIDNIEEYSKNVDYIPERIRFQVSNELPKLLIHPLYGNDPTYGIRELIQNSVDACRAREFIETSPYQGEVTISFFKEGDMFYFQIEDNGMGMSLHIIKNYFLEVGASLRKSSYYKKKLSDNVGNSKIQRSGKFGIGVLAAFLIGDKIILSTKDASSDSGLTFETNLNNDFIEITKFSTEKIGTLIQIPISEKTIDRLNGSKIRFDKWYTHSSPKVIFNDTTGIFGDLGYSKYAPGYNDELPETWHQLKSDEYNKVIWSYHFGLDRHTRDHVLTCNGILVPSGMHRSPSWIKNSNSYNRDINLPHVSIFDFNGRLPLNLSRNSLDGRLSFEKELYEEIYKDMVAKLLTSNIETPIKDDKMLISSPSQFSHSAINDIDILFSKTGFIIRSNYFKKKNKDIPLLRISPKIDTKFLFLFDCKNAFVDFMKSDEIAMSSFQYQANLLYLSPGGKLFLESSMYKRLMDNKYNRYPISVRRSHELLTENDGMVEISYRFKNGIFGLSDLLECAKNTNYIIETMSSEIVYNDITVTEDILTKHLENYLQGQSYIPYDLDERKKKFPKAFEELAIYMEKYIT